MSDGEGNDPAPYRDAQEASRIYVLPNSFTAGNLFFGYLAILRCIQANQAELAADSENLFKQAVWFILLAVLCDGLDGRVARLGGRESLFGKEFDSIADVVSFGVAPTLMMLFLILKPSENYTEFLEFGWLIAFVYLLCAGIRLARFNVITHPMLPPARALRESKDFLGLPVPAAAGMIASLVLVLTSYDLRGFSILLPVLMLSIALLMVSSIRYPSFKEVDWSTRTRLRSFIGLAAALASVFLFRQFAIAVLFLSYILSGPVLHLLRLRRVRRRRKSGGRGPG